MVTIETKYLDYRKPCRILPAVTHTGATNTKQTNQVSMKTNTIKVITTIASLGLIAGLGSTTVTGNYLTAVAVTVSYLAVVALIAIAAADYRPGSKGGKLTA